MKSDDLIIQRLVNQQITNSKLRTPAEMIALLGAMQAQEYAQAKWALGLRLPHLTDGDVEIGFNKGKILRTHLLRPTWHFVTPDDIRWLLKLTGTRIMMSATSRHRELGIDAPLIKKCNDLLVKLLEGGKHATRAAIRERFEKNRIDTNDARLSHLLMCAELDGVICSGPRQGKQFTYMLLDERVPRARSKTRDESIAELTRRYFKSRGPATVYDFAAWSDLTIADCKAGIAMIGSRLLNQLIDGKLYFFPEPGPAPKAPPPVHLLPVYDEYVMGYRDRDAIVDPKLTGLRRGELPFENAILFEGKIIGMWKRTIFENTIDMVYDFAGNEKIRMRDFKAAVSRYARFQGVRVSCKSGRLTTRPKDSLRRSRPTT